MANTATNTERARFIADARAVLDMLEANPNVPLPWRFLGQYAVAGTDAEKCAEVDRIAAILGVEPETRANGGHYAAEVRFGSNGYVALAITDAHMARFHEESRLGTEAYERLHGGAGRPAEESTAGVTV